MAMDITSANVAHQMMAKVYSNIKTPRNKLLYTSDISSQAVVNLQEYRASDAHRQIGEDNSDFDASHATHHAPSAVATNSGGVFSLAIPELDTPGASKIDGLTIEHLPEGTSYLGENGAIVPAQDGVIKLDNINDGTLSFSLPDGDISSFTATVSATSGEGQVTQSAPVDVFVNGAPIVTSPVEFEMLEDGSFLITKDALLGNAYDPDGDALSVENLSIPDGTLTDNGDGTWTFQPDENFNGDITFSYDISDGLDTISTTGSILVEAVNDNPQFSSAPSEVASEGGNTITGQLTATDVDDNATATFAVAEGAQVPDGFTLNEDGSYSFDPANSAYDHLAVGDSTTLTIPVTVTDDQGATDTTQIQITVNGTNDAPVAQAEVITSAAEGASVITGQLTAADIDDNSTATFAVAEGAQVPDGFTLNEDGSYSFDPANSAYDHLAVGDSTTLTIPVTVTDDQGATDTTQIQITVNGTNDGPVVSEASNFSTPEDTTITLTQDQLLANASDVDGDTLSVGNLQVDGGTLVDNGDGSWNFTPDENFNGELNYTFDVSDGHTTTPANGTITVNAVNDAPVAVDDGGNSALHLAGRQSLNLGNSEDFSFTDQFTISMNVEATGQGVSRYHQGGILFNKENAYELARFEDGSVKYALKDEHGNWAWRDTGYDLPEGEEHNVTFTYDGDAREVSLYIDGDNVFTGSKGVPSRIIQNNNDLLIGDRGRTTQSLEGNISEVTVFEDTLSNDDVNAFLAGNNVNANIVAQYDFTGSNPLADQSGNGHTGELAGGATITYSGFEVAEDSTINVGVLANDTDVDGDVLSITQIAGQDVSDGQSVDITDSDGNVIGSAQVVNGQIQFTPGEELQHLSEGESQSVSFEYSVSDGAASDTGNVTIDVTGTNDAPIAQAAVTTSAAEGALVITGQLTATDVDDNATATFAVAEGAQVPDGFTLNEDGSYSFDPANSAYDHLAVGDSTTLTIPVTVTDDQGATDTTQIQITVNGTNDAPVAQAKVVTATDEGGSVIAGQLTATDIDDNSTATFAVAEGAQVPDGFTLNEDGSYSFDPANSAYDHLAVGDSTTLIIPVTVTDDQGATDTTQIQITVNGTNDGPVVSEAGNFSTPEDTTITLTQDQLLANASDVDGDTLSVGNLQVDGGTLVDNGDGSWNFTPDENFNGELNYTFDVSDGHTTTPANGTITVDAVNDAPVAANDSLGGERPGTVLVSENFENGAEGWSDNTVTETDTNATNFLGRFGGTGGEEGVSKVFDLGQEHAGETVNIEFDMYEIDSWDNEEFKVFVNGDEVSSDHMSHYGSGVDPRPKDVQDGGTEIDNIGSSGRFYFDHDEAHHYSIQAVVDDNGQVRLGFGSTLNQRLSDESWGIDNLEIRTVDPAGISEDESLTVNVSDILANDMDVDNDALDITDVSALVDADGNEIASVDLNDDGTISVTPNGSLAAGETANGTFTYTVSDGHGGTDTAQVTLDIVGTNDAPQINVVDAVVMDEGSAVVTGQLTAEDADHNATATFAVAEGAQVPDGFTLNEDGSYSFDPANSVYDHLAVGDSVTLTVPVTVTDDQGASDTTQIQITVNGTNDAPVAQAEVITSAAEGASVITGQLTAADADDNATATFAVAEGAQVPDGFTLNEDGSYSFDPANSAYDHLGVGDSTTLTIPVTVTDDQGATDTTQIQITVNGTNDGPVVSEAGNFSTPEDTTITLTQDQLLANASDVDGDTLSVGNLQVDGGTLVDNGDGSWNFTPDENFNGELNYTFDVSDGHTTTQANGTITVDAVNDAPVAANDSLGGEGPGTVLVSEDFENGAEGWSDNTVTETDTNATNFLGRFGGTGGEEGVSKVFDLGPEHAGETVNVEFDMYEIDSWDDEAFKVFVNGDEVSSDYMSHYGRTWSNLATDEQDGGTALDNIGSRGQYYLDHDEAHHYSMQAVVDENGQVRLGFGSTLNGNINDESWGIDNLVITSTEPSGITENDSLTLQVDDILANDIDVDNDALDITDVSALVDADGNEIASVDLNDDGTISVTPNGSLAAGETADGTFTYTVSDGHGGTDTAQVTLDIVGTNDAPQINVVDAVVLDEGSAVVTGQLTATDVDDNSTATFAVAEGAQVPGGFALNEDGSYSFDPANSAYDHLAVGDSVTLTVPVTVTDDQGATDTSQIQITVNGTNDAPVAQAEVITSAAEGASAITGQLTAADVDDNATATFAVSEGAQVPDGFALNEDGSYSFDPANSAYDHLAVGDSTTLTIPVTVTDDQGATDTTQIQITVNGTNDGPVVSEAGNFSTDEDTTITLTQDQLLANASDVDGDTLSVENLQVDGGTLVDNGDGSWNFTPDENFNGELNYTFDVSDGHTTTPANGTITVNAVNNAPTAVDDGGSAKLILTGNQSMNLGNSEDFSFTNHFTISMDVEITGQGLGDYHQGGILFNKENAYELARFEDGSVKFAIQDEKGRWSWKDTGYDLPEGEEHNVTFVYDGDAKEASLYIDGDHVFSGRKGVPRSIMQTDSDLRIGDREVATHSLEGNISKVAVFEDSLSSDDISAFLAGDTVDANMVAQYDFRGSNPLADTSGNGHIATLHGGATISSGASEITENETLTLQVDDILANDIDIDNDTLNITDVSALVDADGNEIASVDLNDDGTISVTPNGSLAADETADGTFTYTVSDGHGGTDTAQVSVNITGTNDAPQINVVDAVALDEGSDVVTGQLTATDADHNATATFSVAEGAQVPDGFTLNDDGSYSFDPANSAYDHLAAGESVDLTIPVTVTDDQGATDTTQIQITVNGTDEDSPASANVVTPEEPNPDDYATHNTGTEGTDILTGGASDSLLEGEGGNDILQTYWGNDYLDGGSGDDQMSSGTGDDQLIGGGGDDNMRGEQGDDTLVGGQGDDTLRGDAGDDIIDGGSGHDTAIYSGDIDEYNIFDDGNGSVTIQDTVPGRDGTDTVSDVEEFTFDSTQVTYGSNDWTSEVVAPTAEDGAADASANADQAAANDIADQPLDQSLDQSMADAPPDDPIIM